MLSILPSLNSASSFLYLWLSVSPRALRSAAQQLLNYSQPTTLCIFCAVPLHPSRIFPVSRGLSSPVCSCVPCNCTSTRCNKLPTSACVWCVFFFCCFCIYFRVPHLCHWMFRSARLTVFTPKLTYTHVRVSHRQTCPQFKTVRLLCGDYPLSLPLRSHCAVDE